MTSNIPFSLAYRIVRICSKPADREKHFGKLKEMLLARDYKSKLIDAAIEKARNIPRAEALKKVVREKNQNRPVFVVTFDPRLPSMTQTVHRHYRTMVQDPYLKEVFPEPPLIAFRRQKNIREFLIRAKVPPVPSRPKRALPGMKKCGRCLACSYVKTGKNIKSTSSNFTAELNTAVDCNTSGVVYCIECKICRTQYVGKTKDKAKERFLKHRGYVQNKELSQATGNHFNLPGHSVSDMTFTIIEKVHRKDPFFLRQREKFYIQKFNVKMKGINKNS